MDGGEQRGGGSGHTLVETGEWAGWSMYDVDPFEELAGPFHHKVAEDGRRVCAMRVEAKHTNGSGFMHGGAIMTFADYCLFVIAHDHLQDGRNVTATFNSEFVGAVAPGALLECTGEVIKAGRSLVFVRGLMTSGGGPVMTFSGVIKKLAPWT